MVMSVYEERGIEKGELRAERRTLLRQMELKFGTVPEKVRARIEAISDIDMLDAVLTATSVEEMGI